MDEGVVDDPVHDAGPLQHGEVPVGGALGESGAAIEELRDRERLGSVAEELDDRAALVRVALAVGAQPVGRRGVEGSVDRDLRMVTIARRAPASARRR